MGRKKKKKQEELEEQQAAEAAAADQPEKADEAQAPEETLEHWKDRALRIQAEMMNMRRRAEQDVEDRTRMRLEALFSELIMLEDHFGLALGAVPGDLRERDDTKTFLDGVQAIAAALRGTLTRFGLEAIEPGTGAPFDPEVHEAVQIEPREGLESDQVELLRCGYRMGRRILRPAQVKLLQAANAGQKADEADPETDETAGEPSGQAG